MGGLDINDLFPGQNHFCPTWSVWYPSTNSHNKWSLLLLLQKLLDLINLWLSLNCQELLVASCKRSTATNLGHSFAGKEGLTKATKTYRSPLMKFGPAFWIHQDMYGKQSDYKTFCAPTSCPLSTSKTGRHKGSTFTFPFFSMECVCTWSSEATKPDHLGCESAMVRLKSNKTSKFWFFKLRLDYVELRTILRVIMGCLRGYYGFSTGLRFFTGFPRAETWLSNPLVETAIKMQSAFCFCRATALKKAGAIINWVLASKYPSNLVGCRGFCFPECIEEYQGPLHLPTCHHRGKICTFAKR